MSTPRFQSKKNIVLMGVAGVLIAGAVLLLFRDRLSSNAPAEAGGLPDEVLRAADPADAAAEPPSTNFSKKAKSVGDP